MGVGVYGVTRPSDVSVDDIDMFYNYIPNRETNNSDMIRLNANELLSYSYLPEDERIFDDDVNNNILEGLYNLRLPSSIFSQLGIYTIYIKPKSFMITIMDCNVLSAQPNVKGIVINVNDLPEGLRGNNALQGYRIEYIDTLSNNKIRNVVRYIVTSNKVVPINENVGNANQRSTKYKFEDSVS